MKTKTTNPRGRRTADTKQIVATARPLEPVEHLLALFDGKRGELEWFLKSIVSAFDQVAPKDVQRCIHSVRGRIKDRDHLARKIERKRAENRQITSTGFFEQLEDLAAARVVTLYRADVPKVHAFIMSAPTWRLLHDPVAYYSRNQDRDDFVKWKIPVAERGTDQPYTSVHYIVGPAGAESRGALRCEIQLRSLHTEGWAEVDHDLRYPDLTPGPIAEAVLGVLHEAVAVSDGLARLASLAAGLHAQAIVETKSMRAQVEQERTKAAELAAKLTTMESQLAALSKSTDAGARRQAVAASKTAASIKQLVSELPRATEPSGSISVGNLTFFTAQLAKWVAAATTVTSGPTSCEACRTLAVGGKRCARCGRLYCDACIASGRARPSMAIGASVYAGSTSAFRLVGHAPGATVSEWRCQACSDQPLR